MLTQFSIVTLSELTENLDSIIDDKLDSTLAKVNELDARVSKIEEKEY